MRMETEVKAVCVSEKRGTVKRPVEFAVFRQDYGIEGDAHAGNWHRQVSLLSWEKIQQFKESGADVEYGDFGENLVVSGFDFRSLPVGTRFICGDVVLEMTQIGKECHAHCQIYHRMGDCIMPREGVFARVVSAGVIRPGMEFRMTDPEENRPLRAAVITLSDKGALGERTDESGPAVSKRLAGAGYRVEEELLLADEQKRIETELIRLSDGRQLDLILTTGGTGFSKRDVTPEATLAVAERNAPGISEAIRCYSMQLTKRAMLSRGVSVIRGSTLIVNLPGSPKAVNESLDCILDTLEHGIRVLKGTAAECAAQVRPVE